MLQIRSTPDEFDQQSEFDVFSFLSDERLEWLIFASPFNFGSFGRVSSARLRLPRGTRRVLCHLFTCSVPGEGPRSSSGLVGQVSLWVVGHFLCLIDRPPVTTPPWPLLRDITDRGSFSSPVIDPTAYAQVSIFAVKDWLTPYKRISVMSEIEIYAVGCLLDS